jgi:flagellar motor switch protein FliM
MEAQLRSAPSTHRLGISHLRTQAGVPAEALQSFRPRFEALATRLSSELERLAGTALKLVVDVIEKAASGAEAYESDMHWLSARLTTESGSLELTARLDRHFVFAICEAAFGGTGTGKPYQEERPFSKIEKKLCTGVFAAIAKALPEILAGTARADAVFHIADDETDAKTGLAAVASAEAKLLLNVFGYNGELVLSLPKQMLGALKDGEIAKRPSAPLRPIKPRGLELGSQLGAVDLDLTVVLAAVELDLRELTNLRVGQLLHLPARLDSLLKVYCENQFLFDAAFARSDTAYAISVNRMG